MDIKFVNNINDNNLVTKNAFEQYDLLSQIILNAIKYSEMKPITVEFSKTDAHQKLNESFYTLTVINHGTTPLVDSDIDKILEGTGYRPNNRKIGGTGTGYKEIIAILKRNCPNFDPRNIIEKGRKNGVKCTVPFRLTPEASSIQNKSLYV